MTLRLRAIRFTDEQWDALTERAAVEGVGASAIVRKLVDEYLSSQPKESK